MYQDYEFNRRQAGNVSQSQASEQVANPYPLRNHEVNVSRGIFTNRKENIKPETTPRSKLAANSDQLRGLTGTYNQVMKDFMDNDLQSQITQFKNEMIKVMNDSLRDFTEKSNRNQEAISIIKESIKNHGSNIDKLDQKIEEYHSGLEAISEMFRSEIEKIKVNLPQQRSGYLDPKNKLKENSNGRYDQKLQKLEGQQQDLLVSFERLKNEVTQSIQMALQEYGDVSERDGNDRINKISHEITLNMEQKIAKVINHLDGKVQVLEKQIQNYERPDDAIVDNLRFQMEDKVSEQTSNIRQQIQDLYQMIEAKSDIPKVSHNNFEVEQRIDRTKQELEILKTELASVIEQVRVEGKILNSKLEEYERKFNEECRQLKNHRANENLSMNKPIQELERRVGSIERQFNEVHQEQKALVSDINIQRAQLDSFKTTSAINFSDLKNNQSNLEDIRLKKLEQLVDQLTKNVETLKPALNSPGSSSTKVIETNSPIEFNNRDHGVIRHENFTSFGFPANMKAHAYNYEQQIRDQAGPGGASYRGDIRPPVDLSAPEKTYGSHINYNPPVIISAKEMASHYTPREMGQYYTGYGKVETFGTEQKNLDRFAGNSQGFENANLMKRDEEKSSKSQRDRRSNGEGNEEDEVEVVYQINENGYLMDEDGNFIYDDQGEMIKLNEKQIERLRENNLLEESSVTQ